MPLDLDQQFREVIIKVNGGTMKRGDLKDSVQEAIHDWIRKKNQGR